MNAKMDSNPYIGNAAEKDPATFFVAIANVERDQDQDQESGKSSNQTERKELLKTSKSDSNTSSSDNTSSNSTSDSKKGDKKMYTTIDLFSNGKEMSFITINCCLSWFAFSLAYYGLSTGSAALPTDIYVTNWIFALCDFPSCFFATYFMGKIGRKKTCYLSFMIGASLLLISTLLLEITYCEKDEKSIFESPLRSLFVVKFTHSGDWPRDFGRG